jgi:hypothetical protein
MFVVHETLPRKNNWKIMQCPPIKFPPLSYGCDHYGLMFFFIIVVLCYGAFLIVFIFTLLEVLLLFFVFDAFSIRKYQPCSLVFSCMLPSLLLQWCCPYEIHAQLLYYWRMGCNKSCFNMFFNSFFRWGKNTLSPPNIIATNTIFLYLVFFGNAWR